MDDLDISFVLKFEADGKKASAGLEIASKTTEAKSPSLFEIQIKAFANFEVVGPEHQDVLAVYLRKFAAAAALIGATREQVALMTARGPWGGVTLSIISMDRVVGPPPKKKERNAETVAAMEEARTMSATRLATPKNGPLKAKKRSVKSKSAKA